MARRAQSYSDFHYAVQAVLDPDAKGKAKAEEKSDDEAIKDDLEFMDWYERYEYRLLEASLDKYTYGSPELLDQGMKTDAKQDVSQ